MKNLVVLFALAVVVAIPARAQVITGFGSSEVNPVTAGDLTAPWAYNATSSPVTLTAQITSTSVITDSVSDFSGGMGEFLSTPITLNDTTYPTLSLLLTGQLDAAAPSGNFQITLYDPSFNTLTYTASWSSFSQSQVETVSLGTPVESGAFNGQVQAWSLIVGGGPSDTLSFTFDNLDAVPEPSTYAMLGFGLLALFAWNRRGKRA